MLAFFLALLTGVATACTSGATGQSSDTSAQNGSNQVLTWASDDIADTFDPAVASSQPELQFAKATYETLVNYDSTARKLTPGLARAWSESENATKVTLTLQRGVTFHDGSKLTPQGVVASLQRTIDIGKGEAFLLSNVKSMSPEGSDSVTIELKKPDASFLYGLQRIFIASDRAIKEHAGSDNGTSWFSTHEAGSGPYMLKSFKPASQLILTKYQGYWRGWTGDHVSEYVINVVDPATEVLQIKQGTADLATAIPTDDAYSMQNTSGVQVDHYPGSPFYLLLNSGKAPFNNAKIREAVSLAVDYNAINEQIMHGWAGKLTGPLPDWVADSNNASPPKYAPAEAKKILAEAGYNSSNPLQFTFLYFNGWTFEQTIATVLQADLAQIGVKVTVKGVPWATFTEQVGNPHTRPDMAACAVYVPTPTPGPVLTASFDPASEGQWSYLGYNNPAVTKLLDKASNATNATEQASLYREAQAQLVNGHAAIWLMVMPDVFVTTDRVHGLQHDPSWGLVPNYYDISLQ
ncbi:MAG TPA: ABC transporter substrate-binding protein [Longimicrobiaceae bacterium]|nr:ABC transporter substrate-binding protein [Longimicrobiaceae bacterium]